MLDVVTAGFGLKTGAGSQIGRLWSRGITGVEFCHVNCVERECVSLKITETAKNSRCARIGIFSCVILVLWLGIT